MLELRNESLTDQARQEKKPYARPQLIQHGAVDSLTQHVVVDGSPSNCID